MTTYTRQYETVIEWMKRTWLSRSTLHRMVQSGQVRARRAGARLLIEVRDDDPFPPAKAEAMSEETALEPGKGPV